MSFKEKKKWNRARKESLKMRREILKKGEILKWGKNGEGLGRREENEKCLKMRQKMWGVEKEAIKSILKLTSFGTEYEPFET